MNAKLLVLSTALAAAASVTASAPAIGEVGNESPAFVATDPMRGKAIVANPASGTLQLADLRDLQVTPAALAGKNARAVVVNAVSGIAYVVDDTAPGWVVAVDIENGRVIRRTAVGHRPSHISADFPRGELYVSNRGDGSVSIVHAATLKVITAIPVGSEPGASSVDARRGLLYVVSGARRIVDVIDLELRQVAASVTVGTNPGAATIDEHSGKVYVNNVDDRTVSVIDPASFKVVRTIPAGAGSTSGTLSSVHRRYYLPNADDNRVSVIDTQHDRIVALVSVGRGPRAALLSATEDELYVLNHGDASASVLDTSSGSVTTTLAAGWSPRGAIAMSAQLLTVNDDNGGPDGGLLAITPIVAAETALATEYVNATRQRYVHTADGLEARLIADGLYGDQWRRTMRFFRVWTKQDTGSRSGMQILERYQRGGESCVRDAGRVRGVEEKSGLDRRGRRLLRRPPRCRWRLRRWDRAPLPSLQRQPRRIRRPSLREGERRARYDGQCWLDCRRPRCCRDLCMRACIAAKRVTGRGNRAIGRS